MNNWDMNSINKRHQNQLKVASGYRPNTAKYEFITSQDELINSYLHRMDDLGYPLRVEPKRDRYVVNKKALQDALEHATVEALKQMDREINEWINTDVRNCIEYTAQDVMNSINVVNNHFVVRHSSNHSNSSSWGLKFAERLGTALGKAIANIIDDTFFPKGKY